MNGASVSIGSIVRVPVAVIFSVPGALSGAGAGAVVVADVAAGVAIVAVGLSVVVGVVAATVVISARRSFLSSDVMARWLPLGALPFRSVVPEEVIFSTLGHGKPFATLLGASIYNLLEFFEVFCVQVFA